MTDGKNKKKQKTEKNICKTYRPTHPPHRRLRKQVRMYYGLDTAGGVRSCCKSRFVRHAVCPAAANSYSTYKMLVSPAAARTA